MKRSLRTYKFIDKKSDSSGHFALTNYINRICVRSISQVYQLSLLLIITENRWMLKCVCAAVIMELLT